MPLELRCSSIGNPLRQFGLHIGKFWDLYIGGPFTQAFDALKSGAFLQAKVLGNTLGGMFAGMVIQALLALVTAGATAALAGTRLGALVEKISKLSGLVGKMKQGLGHHLDVVKSKVLAKLEAAGAKARGLASKRWAQHGKTARAVAAAPIHEQSRDAIPLRGRKNLILRQEGGSCGGNAVYNLLRSHGIDTTRDTILAHLPKSARTGDWLPQPPDLLQKIAHTHGLPRTKVRIGRRRAAEMLEHQLSQGNPVVAFFETTVRDENGGPVGHAVLAERLVRSERQVFVQISDSANGRRWLVPKGDFLRKLYGTLSTE